jgi:hypothetical protein
MKNCKTNKWHEKWQTKQNDNEELRKAQAQDSNSKTHKTPETNSL